MRDAHLERDRFGVTLRQIRKDHGFTLKQVEGLTGIRFPTLSSIENGERAVSASSAILLADAFALEGQTRDDFLFSAAATRKKDKLVAYARSLDPEIINFVAKTLLERGLLDQIASSRIGNSLPASDAENVAEANKCVAEEGRNPRINPILSLEMINGQKYVCSLLVRQSA